jgi:predicted dehydrogenase
VQRVKYSITNFEIILNTNHMSYPVLAGLASYGMSGKVFHGPLLSAHANFKVAAVLERHREESRGMHPDSLLVRSFDELCRMDSLELIVVNTPDPAHFEYCKQALEAGKHVVVEKPFTQTAEEAKILTALAAARRRMLTVFHNRRWDSDFLTVQKIVQSEELGRLTEFEAHFDRFRPEVTTESWKESATSHTGTLYNLGSHLIDQSLVLFGNPRGVYADIRKMRDRARVDDSFELLLRYDSVRVSLKASYLVKEPGPKFIVHGTKGSFVKWGADPQEEALKAGVIPGGQGWGAEKEQDYGLLNTVDHGVESRRRVPSLHGNYLQFYDGVYEAVRNGHQPPVDPSGAGEVIRIIEAAYLSSRERREISL